MADDAPVMGEEIFGPLLPIIPVADVDAAIARINADDKPLALYAFSRSQKTLDHIVDHTSSGGVALNHVVLHLTWRRVCRSAASGSPAWGRITARRTSTRSPHRKSVLNKPTRLDPPILYPPFTSLKQWIVRKAMTGSKT